jgi:DNA-binding beta-propeller fold protein YncE
MNKLYQVLLVSFFAVLSDMAQAAVIVDSNRFDIAYDTVRQVLYISGGTTVRRYDMVAKKFLTAITLGGNTAGMDISADGQWLAVANQSKGATKNFVDLIKLQTLTKTRVGFDLITGEAGTFAVAFDQLGNLLVTSNYDGSNWVPFWRYNYFTKQTTKLGDIRQSSMLAAAADRSKIAVVESNISNGAWGIYTAGNNTYTSNFTSGWYNFEIGMSYNGTQAAILTSTALIYDTNNVLPSVGTAGGVTPIGVAYSPVEKAVYFAMGQSNQIAKYNTTTMAKMLTYTLPTGYRFTQNTNAAAFEPFVEGRLKVASDNSFLFATVGNGVYYQALRTPAK